MLLETTYKTGDTISLKLTSGEELVARLEEQKDTQVTIHKPMVLVANQQGLGLAPFMFSVSGDKFNINTNVIVCVAKTEDGLAKQYIKQTTGIVT